jgi:hypothetical protein
MISIEEKKSVTNNKNNRNNRNNKNNKNKYNKKGKKNQKQSSELILNETNDCFFCLDIIVDSEIEKTHLKYNKYYIKTCQCDGYIHNECLEKWYNKHKKCPICRNIVFEKKELFIENIENINILTNYLYIKKKLFIIITQIILFIFFIQFINMVFSI